MTTDDTFYSVRPSYSIRHSRRSIIIRPSLHPFVRRYVSFAKVCDNTGLDKVNVVWPANKKGLFFFWLLIELRFPHKRIPSGLNKT